MVEIKIPIYQPDLSGREKEYVMDCLESTWISSKGKYINLFEQKFAEYIGVSHAASVCNGTVALHLALLALGIGEGDEVIVPTLTYIASVNAITYTGATPVFVDSLQTNWQIDPEDVRKKITTKTKAVMAVHLYGHPCNMTELVSICKENNIFLVEDCAEAIGSSFNGRKVGNFGDVSTFSFFGNKTITSGEGGMVVTNNPLLDDKLRHFKGQGLAKNREYWHDVIGYNYRMTNIEAAIGLAQLEKVDQFVNRKYEIAHLYRKAFLNSPVHFHTEEAGCFHTYWMCSILVPRADQRDPLRELLRKNGIETRPLFYPIHKMPMYKKTDQTFPIAEDLAARGINLPSYPGLNSDQIQFISKSVIEFFKK